jgi:hypothetical protein
MTNYAAITQVKVALRKLTSGTYTSSYEDEIAGHLRLALVALGPDEITIHEGGELITCFSSRGMTLIQIGFIQTVEELDDGNYELASGVTVEQLMTVINQDNIENEMPTKQEGQ